MKRNAGWMWVPVFLIGFIITGAVAVDDAGDGGRVQQKELR